MKLWKTSLVLLMLITACKCNNGKDRTTGGDSVLVIPDALLVYEVDAENKTLKKYTEVPDSAFTAVRVINGLNEVYPRVQIKLLRQSNDTLYISVPDDTRLAQKMGSAGSEAWFATTVLNLTAIKGISYVNIDLEEGDHASPGIFSREDYPGYKTDSTAAHQKM
jgi:hypothetical protein